ncbi:MAG: NifU family protein [Acidimicrobiales bacterium]
MSIDTDETEAEAPERILDVTPAALETVLGILADEEEPDGLALRVEITGVAGVEYQYDLAFESVADAAGDDVIYEIETLSVIVPANSVTDLQGSMLDLPANANQPGLVIRNPNRPNPLGSMDNIELTGSTIEKVQQLLEQQINPMLASHGGYATLVSVEPAAEGEGDVVHLTMGGGCQGCSMSALTLTEGIKTAILETITEVVDVVDATDHAAGATPYYS